MTEAEELFLELTDLGVSLFVEDCMVKARPVGKLNAGHREKVKRLRDGLLTILSDSEPGYAVLVAWFEGVEVPDGLVLGPGETVTDGQLAKAYYGEQIRAGQAKGETAWFLRKLRAALKTRGES